MLWFTCESIPLQFLFMVNPDYTECCCFCHSVPFLWCSCVYRIGRWRGHLFCVRNVSWEVSRLVTDSLSIPVPFHSWVDVCISHCSNMFCLPVQTLLAWLIMGQHIFELGLSYGGRFWLEARCYGPLCRSKSGYWQREKFREQKRSFAGQQLWDCFFPPPPLMVLRQCFTSPSAPSQYALGWIPFLIKIQLGSMKSSPPLRVFFCWLLCAVQQMEPSEGSGGLLFGSGQIE